MIQPYRATTIAAVSLAAAVLGLIVLASLGLVGRLEPFGTSLWPYAIIGACIAFFVACWALAKSKGLPGWYGVLYSVADVAGFWMLLRRPVRASDRT